MRDDPAEIGGRPYGAGGTAGSSADRNPVADGPDVPLSGAVKSGTFWLLAGSFFICGATSSGLIGTHMIPHSIDRGFPEVAAAATMGVMGGLNFVGTLLSGWMIDRIAARKWLALVYALRGAALFLLPFVTDTTGLLVFALIYGLDWFATVPPTIAMTADAFGRRAVGTIFGWIFLSHQLGAALAATGAGAIRVAMGDYQMAFLSGGLMALIAAALAYGIRVSKTASMSRSPLTETIGA
jgi:MFS family permease